MRQTILERLTVIEQKHQVRILHACESGSRAWGFPSEDSDYDVRFLYIHPRDWYLRVDGEFCRDVIEEPINDLLDINGWDLQKALKLLKKCNPTLIEWLHSPIIYRQEAEFIEGIQPLVNQYYAPRACFYHYSHMAECNFREYLQDEKVKLKRYFYVLRPLLAMRWIEQGRGIIPVEFQQLVEAVVDDPQILAEIDKLLAQKHLSTEKDNISRVNALNHFIESELRRFAEKGNIYDANQADFEDLNDYFISALKQFNTGLPVD